MTEAKLMEHCLLRSLAFENGAEQPMLIGRHHYYTAIGEQAFYYYTSDSN